MAAHAYTLTIPRSLFEEWGWFEYRGYLPEMPGELLTEGDDSPMVSLGLTEPEAWEFADAAEEEGFCSCVADPEGIMRLLTEIV